jgi:hypothetical protein
MELSPLDGRDVDPWHCGQEEGGYTRSFAITLQEMAP